MSPAQPMKSAHLSHKSLIIPQYPNKSETNGGEWGRESTTIDSPRYLKNEALKIQPIINHYKMPINVS